jgi:hypothetical protein
LRGPRIKITIDDRTHDGPVIQEGCPGKILYLWLIRKKLRLTYMTMYENKLDGSGRIYRQLSLRLEP